MTGADGGAVVTPPFSPVRGALMLTDGLSVLANRLPMGVTLLPRRLPMDLVLLATTSLPMSPPLLPQMLTRLRPLVVPPFDASLMPKMLPGLPRLLPLSPDMRALLIEMPPFPPQPLGTMVLTLILPRIRPVFTAALIRPVFTPVLMPAGGAIVAIIAAVRKAEPLTIPMPAAIMVAPIAADREPDDGDVDLGRIGRHRHVALTVVGFEILGIRPAALAAPAHVTPVILLDTAVNPHMRAVRQGIDHRVLGSGPRAHVQVGRDNAAACGQCQRGRERQPRQGHRQ